MSEKGFERERSDAAMSRRITFTIHRLTMDGGKALVDGRVCESPIRIGDVFTTIRGHEQCWDGKNWIPANPKPIEVVRLVVVSIESYGRSWDELLTGMTARLLVAGEGLDKMLEGRILENLQALE